MSPTSLTVFKEALKNLFYFTGVGIAGIQECPLPDTAPFSLPETMSVWQGPQPFLQSLPPMQEAQIVQFSF